MKIRFEDLEFVDHEQPFFREHGIKVARITFENGYTASVLQEIDVLDQWGKDGRFEVGALMDGRLQGQPARRLSRKQTVELLQIISNMPKKLHR